MVIQRGGNLIHLGLALEAAQYLASVKVSKTIYFNKLLREWELSNEGSFEDFCKSKPTYREHMDNLVSDKNLREKRRGSNRRIFDEILDL